jgi:hypothetical protein
MKYFVVEASADSTNNWNVIGTFDDDKSLPKAGFSVAYWDLKSSGNVPDEGWRRFRLRMTGKNASNGTMSCSGFELYGTLRDTTTPDEAEKSAKKVLESRRKEIAEMVRRGYK